ncbi:hypothetical protein MRX96_030742 [Rhipicephalus microplus]
MWRRPSPSSAAPARPVSVCVCGPTAMINHAKEEKQALRAGKRRVQAGCDGRRSSVRAQNGPLGHRKQTRPTRREAQRPRRTSLIA